MERLIMGQFLVVALILVSLSMATASTMEIFCFIEGLISNKGHLNGTFHSCEPSHMHCVMVEHSGPKLDSSKETVNCIEEGFLWDVQNHCSFVHLTRKSYCITMKHCYGVKMKCPNSSVVLTPVTRTILVFIGLAVLSIVALFIVRTAKEIRRSRMLVVAASRKISEATTTTTSTSAAPSRKVSEFCTASSRKVSELSSAPPRKVSELNTITRSNTDM